MPRGRSKSRGRSRTPRVRNVSRSRSKFRSASRGRSRTSRTKSRSVSRASSRRRNVKRRSVSRPRSKTRSRVRSRRVSIHGGLVTSRSVLTRAQKIIRGTSRTGPSGFNWSDLSLRSVYHSVVSSWTPIAPVCSVGGRLGFSKLELPEDVRNGATVQKLVLEVDRKGLSKTLVNGEVWVLGVSQSKLHEFFVTTGKKNKDGDDDYKFDEVNFVSFVKGNKQTIRYTWANFPNSLVFTPPKKDVENGTFDPKDYRIQVVHDINMVNPSLAGSKQFISMRLAWTYTTQEAKL